jgi:hypothetical protein
LLSRPRQCLSDRYVAKRDIAEYVGPTTLMKRHSVNALSDPVIFRYDLESRISDWNTSLSPRTACRMALSTDAIGSGQETVRSDERAFV